MKNTYKEVYLEWAKHCSEIGEELFKNYENKEITKIEEEYRRKIQDSKRDFCEKIENLILDSYTEGQIKYKEMKNKMKFIKQMKASI